jgi:hypothetical protein
MESENSDILMVYGQKKSGDDVILVGNRVALLKLRDTIGDIVARLDQHPDTVGGVARFVDKDGELFFVRIGLGTDSLRESDWMQLKHEYEKQDESSMMHFSLDTPG